MTFGELKFGDRFASGNPDGRRYQKISHAHAIDLTEGVTKKGEWFKDYFTKDYPVFIKNDEEPAVENYDPEKVIFGE